MRHLNFPSRKVGQDFLAGKVKFGPIRERWVVKIEDGPDLDLQGSILDHEYTFTNGRTSVATVSKGWVPGRRQLRRETAPGQNRRWYWPPLSRSMRWLTRRGDPPQLVVWRREIPKPPTP